MAKKPDPTAYKQPVFSRFKRVSNEQIRRITIALAIVSFAGAGSLVIAARAATVTVPGLAKGGSAPAVSQACAKPLFVTSAQNDGWSNGGYYVHNTVWNMRDGGTEFLSACSYKNWYVDAKLPDTQPVKSYPNVHLGLPNASASGVPLRSYNTVTSSFAGKGPGVGAYALSYDITLNGTGGRQSATEVMVWTETHRIAPLGSIKAQYTDTTSGTVFDVWQSSDAGNVVTFQARQTVSSSRLDLKAMITWAISQGYVPADPTLNQIAYGAAISSTDNTKQRFDFTDFSVTLR